VIDRARARRLVETDFREIWLDRERRRRGCREGGARLESVAGVFSLHRVPAAFLVLALLGLGL
jgi:hypothetical protein